ncbi:MAG: IS4 family transposase [Planctomycetota bacterium]|jgi:hypothetical protein
MKIFGRLFQELEDVSGNFTVEAVANDFQPKIEESLKKHEKDGQRKSKLSPLLTVWVILVLPLRRDLNYHNVLSWLLSGLRSLGGNIPRDPVEDGAITHARKRIGVDVIRDLFYASRDVACQLVADFHGLVSIAIDGTTMTMPDTAANLKRFGKPCTGRGKAAFPQLRLVALVATAVHAISDMAFAPIRGKGTGERTLALELILRNAGEGILYLLDRGFYGFDLLHAILQKGAHFIVCVPKGPKLQRIRKSGRDDGSYLAWLVGKTENPAGPGPDGRKRWIPVEYQVRVIEYQIKGFRKRRLVTTLIDFNIPARDIVRHYHKRWEIELVYDAIKTHQCARRKGQCQTVFRSKRPDLVEQELYAMVTIFNLLRNLINQAAEKHELDPLSISFIDALQAVIDAIPGLQRSPSQLLTHLYEQLLDDIASCVMDRWRRPRAYARVVKVKMSNFKLKRPGHKEIQRDFETQTKIFGEVKKPA